MFTTRNKKKCLIISFLILIILILIFVVANKKTDSNNDGEMVIFKINKTDIYAENEEENIVTARRHYMIINPPEDLDELKLVIENYYDNNPIYIKSNMTKHKEMFFYRMSDRLPKNWKPNEGYMETDRIGQHSDDLIATIYDFSEDDDIRYYTTSRSTDDNNYGKQLERIKYTRSR